MGSVLANKWVYGLVVPVILCCLGGVWRSLSNPRLPNPLVYLLNRSDLRPSEKLFGLDLMLSALVSQTALIGLRYHDKRSVDRSAIVLLGGVALASLFLALTIRWGGYKRLEPRPAGIQDGFPVPMGEHTVEIVSKKRRTWALRNPWASDVPNVVGLLAFLVVFVISAKT